MTSPEFPFKKGLGQDISLQLRDTSPLKPSFLIIINFTLFELA